MGIVQLVEQRIVASKVESSSLSIYQMNIFKLLNFYNFFQIKIENIKLEISFNFLLKINFLFNYFFINELIWQEGLLIDFLQKKIIDNWIKKFLIYSSYLFNECLVFETIIKFYLNSIIKLFSKFFIFEFNNVSGIFFITLLFFFIFFYFFLFFFIFLIMF